MMQAQSLPTNDMLTRHEMRPLKEDWVDRTVRLANSCNKLFTRNTCRVCQVYADKQVEFEQRQEGSGDALASPISRVWQKTVMLAPSTLEVELYRQFLFDEESVVETVCERDDKGNAIESSAGPISA
jgi:hypothetical protein